MEQKSHMHAAFAFVIMSAIWGYNWVVMKNVTPFVDPFDFSALRNILGSVSLFMAAWILKRPIRVLSLRKVVLLGLIQTATFTALIQWALVAGGAGKTAVLVYTMPFWLIPLSYIFLEERIRGAQWIATITAAIGLITYLEPWHVHSSPQSTLLAIGAGIAWAVSTVLAKKIRAEFNFDLLALTAWQMLFGGLALAIIALLFSERPIIATPYFYYALVFNALMATALAWLLWLYVIEHMPASLAGLSSLGIPAIGVFSGWIELGEIPTQGELIGMFIINLALLTLALWQRVQPQNKIE